jgi:NAD(P)-dependent dehydrogenase (short-subunit alcohol dehydrogenase family)
VLGTRIRYTWPLPAAAVNAVRAGSAEGECGLAGGKSTRRGGVGCPEDQRAGFFAAASPVRRVGTPEEVAAAVLYLSGAASSLVRWPRLRVVRT